MERPDMVDRLARLTATGQAVWAEDGSGFKGSVKDLASVTRRFYLQRVLGELVERYELLTHGYRDSKVNLTSPLHNMERLVESVKKQVQDRETTAINYVMAMLPSA